MFTTETTYQQLKRQNEYEVARWQRARKEREARTRFWSAVTSATSHITIAGFSAAFLLLSAYTKPTNSSQPGSSPIQTTAAVVKPEPARQSAKLSSPTSLGEISKDGKTLTIYGLFDRGQSQPSGHSTLFDTLAKFVKESGDCPALTIATHTDLKGSAKSNQRLSKNRANHIKEELVKRGVSGGNLNTVGYGETRPLRGISGHDARQRRVTFTCRPQAQASL